MVALSEATYEYGTCPAGKEEAVTVRVGPGATARATGAPATIARATIKPAASADILRRRGIRVGFRITERLAGPRCRNMTSYLGWIGHSPAMMRDGQVSAAAHNASTTLPTHLPILAVCFKSLW